MTFLFTTPVNLAQRGLQNEGHAETFQCQRRLYVCATETVVQTLLDSFLFCRLIAGGCGGFLSFQWFLHLKWTIIQTIQLALGEIKMTVYFIVPY